MEGFGVHTFTMLNKAGKETYVKFHWKPTCGVKSIVRFVTEEEAIRVGGTNHSHATQDLYDSIAAGNYPEWKLFIQTMDPADEDRFDFDPLDITKTWPEDILPLQPVGRLVLNKNIDNFFTENEMLAFNPHIYNGAIMCQTNVLINFNYEEASSIGCKPTLLTILHYTAKMCPHNGAEAACSPIY